MLNIYASGRKKSNLPTHFNNTVALNTRSEGEQIHRYIHIHEIMLPLFSSSHSLLPPPHIWTFGRTRFLCAVLWVEGVFEGGAAPAVWIWSLQLFAELCFNLFKVWMWLWVIYACYLSQWHQKRCTTRFSPACVCFAQVGLLLKICTDIWIVELNMFTDQIYCCWKCTWILEDLEV